MDTKLIRGEALEELRKMPDHYVDAVIIDPPFGIGFNYKEKEANTNPDDYWSWLKPIYEECLRVLKDGGFIAVWQTQLYFKFFWSRKSHGCIICEHDLTAICLFGYNNLYYFCFSARIGLQGR